MIYTKRRSMKVFENVRNSILLTAIAQVTPTVPPVPPVPIVVGATLQELFTKVVEWVLIIAGFVAVLFLLYGGFLYLTAGGNAEAVTKAKTTIVNAVIGVVVIALAF